MNELEKQGKSFNLTLCYSGSQGPLLNIATFPDKFDKDDDWFPTAGTFLTKFKTGTTIQLDVTYKGGISKSFLFPLKCGII